MKKDLKQKVKIVASREEGSQRIYCNYVEVVTGANDISLKFCDIKPPSKEEVDKLIKERQIKAPVLCEVVLTYAVAKSLNEVLERQIKKATGKGNK